MIFSPPLPAVMIAWQATIKPKVRFISLQIKSSPVSLSLGKYYQARRVCSLMNHFAIITHWTLTTVTRQQLQVATLRKLLHPRARGNSGNIHSCRAAWEEKSGPGFIIWPLLEICIDPANTKYSDFLWSFATRDTLQTSTEREGV